LSPGLLASSISYLSISGFASSCSHIRSTSARAPRGVVRLDFEIDHPADTSLADRKAELAQRRFDRLPLRVEDAVLGSNENGGFHRSTTSGLAT
jgi:hypothetical protein